MEFRRFLIAMCAALALACSPQAEAPSQAPAESEPEAAQQAADPGPALKSLHLLNLPDEADEQQLAAAFAEINTAIAEMGYPGSGYRLWKKSGEGEGEYSHVFEGSWPSQAGYDAIHEAEAYQNAVEPHRPTFQKLTENQVYQRYAEVAAAP